MTSTHLKNAQAFCNLESCCCEREAGRTCLRNAVWVCSGTKLWAGFTQPTLAKADKCVWPCGKDSGEEASHASSFTTCKLRRGMGPEREMPGWVDVDVCSDVIIVNECFQPPLPYGGRRRVPKQEVSPITRSMTYNKKYDLQQEV